MRPRKAFIYAAEAQSLELLVVFRSSATRVNRMARHSMMQVWSSFLTVTAEPPALRCPASYKIRTSTENSRRKACAFSRNISLGT